VKRQTVAGGRFNHAVPTLSEAETASSRHFNARERLNEIRLSDNED